MSRVAAALTPHGGPVGGVSGGIFALALLVYLLTRRRLATLEEDEAAGMKVLIDGPIERKETTGQGGNASALQYFLHIKGQRYWVDVTAHDSVSEGDQVRFEYLPKSQIVLRITPRKTQSRALVRAELADGRVRPRTGRTCLGA